MSGCAATTTIREARSGDWMRHGWATRSGGVRSLADGTSGESPSATGQPVPHRIAAPCWCPPMWWERRDESGVHMKDCDRAREALDLIVAAVAAAGPGEEPAQ